MASIIVATEPPSEIEFSIYSGEPRLVTLFGDTIYDAKNGVEKDGWKNQLAQFFKDCGLDRPTTRGRRRAVAYWLHDQGLLDF